jgi:acetyl esterase
MVAGRWGAGPDSGDRFDADVARWLQERAKDPTAADVTVQGARIHARATNARARALRWAQPRPASVEDIRIDVAGGSIQARLYRPVDVGSLPTVLFFHGGGWVAGDLDTHAQHAERLCVEARVVVVAVDFRRAPEHRFPDAFDDCLAATRWAGDHLSALGGDERLAVAGDSAGAQLAASVTLGCREGGPALRAQLLVVPATDLRGGYSDRTVNAEYPSRQENSVGYGLTTQGMAGFTALYGVDSTNLDWRSSPLLARDLRGVPPAVVHVGGFDPLRDEGIAYAARLRSAGVPVRLRIWRTLNHAYFGLGGVSSAADRAAGQAGRDLGVLLDDAAQEPQLVWPA